MTTPALTEREKADIRKRVFEREIRDVDTVLDALNWSNAWHKAMFEWDGIYFAGEFKKVIDLYLSKIGKYAEAEREVLASKERNGRRWLEA